jgi:hypothetical protein
MANDQQQLSEEHASLVEDASVAAVVVSDTGATHGSNTSY